MGKVVKGIGKAVSAPVRGIGHALKTSGIPIVSGLGGSAEKFGNAFAGKGGFLKNFVGGGVPLALTALGGAGLAGSGPLAGLAGRLGRGLGGQITGAFTRPGGGLDLGKVITAGGGLSNMIGARKQRQNAERYANAQIQQRNALMNQIMEEPDYGISTNPAGY